MRSRYYHIFGMFVLSIALSGGQAWGWWEPAPPPSKAPSNADAAAKIETEAPAAANIKPAAKPATPATLKARAKLRTKVQANRLSAAKKRKKRTSVAMNPDAKWACDLKTVKLKPVWRGDKAVTFTFFIRNEGTADLQIKAKGG